MGFVACRPASRGLLAGFPSACLPCMLHAAVGPRALPRHASRPLCGRGLWIWLWRPDTYVEAAQARASVASHTAAPMADGRHGPRIAAVGALRHGARHAHTGGKAP